MCQSGWKVVRKSVDSNFTHRYWVISLSDWMLYWSEDGKRQIFFYKRLGMKSP